MKHPEQAPKYTHEQIAHWASEILRDPTMPPHVKAVAASALSQVQKELQMAARSGHPPGPSKRTLKQLQASRRERA